MPDRGDPIRSFEELLRANDCADVADLEYRVNSRMDGNGFVETEWDEHGVDITVGFGTRGIIAEFKFPFGLIEFWEVTNAYADEVEDFDDDE